MVYSLETPSDVKQHERFHNRFTETANFRVSQTQIEQWKRFILFSLIFLKKKLTACFNMKTWSRHFLVFYLVCVQLPRLRLSGNWKQ